MPNAKYFKYDEEHNLRPIYDDSVIEVVRCRECKHSVLNDYPIHPNYKYFCEKTSSAYHIDYHSENWFCADGERKKAE